MADWNGLSRFVVCIMGVVLSMYALYVEMTKLQNSDYRAMCDINEAISCSKVFTSK